jgi:hypothetical protein
MKKGMVQMSISPEMQKKIVCFKEGCQYASRHCIVYKGYDCIRLGGTKIPTHRSFGRDYSYPKFVGGVDGWTDEGR